jgi:hypothetical protein
MDDHERELADASEDLADTLEALREELQSPPRGPLGLPRPPTPGELFRFTEQYTIPAVISLLETSIRVLELLGGAIRLAEGRAFEEHSTQRADRLADVSRTTLRKLDDALAEVQEAAAGGRPDDPEVRRLLEEARDLRTEVDQRLAAATDTPEERRHDDGETGIEVREETGSESIGIDVDAELESIKREADNEDESNDEGDSSD